MSLSEEPGRKRLARQDHSNTRTTGPSSGGARFRYAASRQMGCELDAMDTTVSATAREILDNFVVALGRASATVPRLIIEARKRDISPGALLDADFALNGPD